MREISPSPTVSNRATIIGVVAAFIGMLMVNRFFDPPIGITIVCGVTFWIATVIVLFWFAKSQNLASQLLGKYASCQHEFGKYWGESYFTTQAQEYARCTHEDLAQRTHSCCGQPLRPLWHVHPRICQNCSAQLLPHCELNYRICGGCGNTFEWRGDDWAIVHLHPEKFRTE